MPRIDINKLNIQPTGITDEERETSEKGPWRVVDWDRDVGLQSDDFHHDVVLYITGDFYDREQKLEYAHKLADRMNRMPTE